MPFRMYLFGNSSACQARPECCLEQALRAATVALVVFPELQRMELDADTLAAESGNNSVLIQGTELSLKFQ